MKKILLFITLISFTITQAQIVNIPDNNFKTKLLNANTTYIAKDINNNPIVVDVNNDNEIQEIEAESVYYLDLSTDNYYFKIHDLTGIEAFINLVSLTCTSNAISTLDLSANINLAHLICNDNILTSLDLSANTALISLYCRANFNMSDININNNTALAYLDCTENSLTSLNISNNPNLINLSCKLNNLTNLDVSNNPSLTVLDCQINNISILDLSTNINLESIECYSNSIQELNVSNSLNLNYLNCNTNNLTTLDLSSNSMLQYVRCGGNPLEYINLKNGNNTSLLTSRFDNLPNLQNVCVDQLNSSLTNLILSEVGHSVTFTEYCSFEPAQSNIINGTVKYNINNDGCLNTIPFSNVLISSNNGNSGFTTASLEDGTYYSYTDEGVFTTDISLNLPNYFTVNPNSYNNTFVGFNNTFTADFCISANQTVNDVSISLIPTSDARPGFNATYQVVFKNIGTTQLSGDITITFEEISLSFLSASENINSQTSNSLTFNYANLNPFETRKIDLTFHIFEPPISNIDDILNFTAAITPISGDNTPNDNTFGLYQTIIGSFDPNDIICLEGDEILLADADKYLHYVIRFQNTGTASAINIVVKNILDAKLDWSTLQLESLSHNNRIAIKNENEIEFIFENINLPDSTTDETNSHGFIAYKIKPKTDIALGDIIPNKADIFFDFNAPIETNTATTEIVNVLAVNENTLLGFSVYPTPTENILNIKSKTEIVKIEIYSKLGQLIKETTGNKVDISNLTQGLYFVKVEDINGNFGVKKIVKK